MDPEKKGSGNFISKHTNLENIFIGLAMLLGIILLINVLVTADLNKEIKKGALSAQEKLKPAKIELTLVKNSKCSDCFDISALVSSIKNANVNITKQSIIEFDSKNGREIISKYGIEKVPAIVVVGDTGKLNAQAFEKKEDALIFSAPPPPYTNALTGKIEGRVVLRHLKDSSCDKCNDLTPLITQIKARGVKISQEKVIEPESKEGKDLAQKYNIDFAPAVILSEDAGAYEIMQQAWDQIGRKEKDAYVTFANPPYVNLTTGTLRGLVSIVFLADKSCAECYDVNQHRQILVQGFGVKLENEETYDISDAKGQKLVNKYNITKAPTIILSDEISVYPVSRALTQFFSVEKDAYVFRQVQATGTYRNLENNEVVEVQAPAEEQ